MVAAGRMRRGSAAVGLNQSIHSRLAMLDGFERPRTGRAGSMGSHRAHPRSSTPITVSRTGGGCCRNRPTVPAVDGVDACWRRKDLARCSSWRRSAISLDETHVCRALELKALELRPRSRRGRATTLQARAWPSRLLKKTSPPNWRRSGRGSRHRRRDRARRWQDEARIRHTKTISSHADGPDVGTRPRCAPATSAPNGPMRLRRDSDPAKGKGAGLVMPLVRHRRHGERTSIRDQCRNVDPLRRPCGARSSIRPVRALDAQSWGRSPRQHHRPGR